MTTPLVQSITDEMVAELEAAAMAATPGPWQWDGREVEDDGYVHIPECSYLVGAICLADNYEGYQDDCDFMAKANPATILALLAERKELVRDAERYRFLRGRMVGVSFDWDDEGMAALAFEMPDNCSFGANCDKNIDAAIDAARGEV